MSTIAYLGVFCIGASLFASVLALSACVLSARISRSENELADYESLVGGHSPAKLKPASTGN
ncbi:MAG: hypothetical protein KC441_07740 [Anaerolineales bacterium]|nr:hypothetical protein [Anaerolineales bacterium]